MRNVQARVVVAGAYAAASDDIFSVEDVALVVNCSDPGDTPPQYGVDQGRGRQPEVLTFVVGNWANVHDDIRPIAERIQQLWEWESNGVVLIATKAKFVLSSAGP